MALIKERIGAFKIEPFNVLRDEQRLEVA